MMPSYLSSAKWLVLVVLGLNSLALGACQGGPPTRTETITLAVPALEQNALVYIADDQRFFERDGLQVTIKNYDPGVATIKAVLQGEADIAGAAEFPFVRAILQQQPLQIIASTDMFEYDFIVGRKDRGVVSVADLKGKRIGVAKQSIAEFFLIRFLQSNGIALQDVTVVDVPPAQFVNAIDSGDVDALIAWQPYISQVVQKQGSGVVIWQAQSNQSAYGVLISSQDWIAARPDTIRRFLQALKDAESYLARYPAESKAIVRRRLNYDSSYMESVWSQHQFSLSLDLSLVIAMSDQARWLTANDLTPGKAIPYLRDGIYLDGLRAVKPEAVSFTR